MGADVAGGTTVLVTGASSGIGRETALLYARRGAQLVLASRGKPALERVALECEAAGAADVLALPTDVGDPDDCAMLVAAAVARYERLDVCVQAAGVAPHGRLEDLPLDVLEGVLRTNVLGTLNVARPVLRQFRQQDGGTLVLLGSVLGRIAVPEMGAYVLTKWAVHAIGRVLHQETRDAPGIHVSVVAPGGVDTPIYPSAANYTGRTPRAPFPVYGPETLARRVADVVERPQREVSVGWANPLLVAGYTFAAPVFDALVGPAMRLLALGPRATRPGPGTVLEPDPGA